MVSNLSSQRGFEAGPTGDKNIANVLNLKTEQIAGIRERLHGKDGKSQRSPRARARSMMIKQRAEPDTREHKLDVNEVLYMDVDFEPSLPVTVELLVDRVASLRPTKVRFQPSEAARLAMCQTKKIGCEDSIGLTGDACGVSARRAPPAPCRQPRPPRPCRRPPLAPHPPNRGANILGCNDFCGAQVS